MAAPLPAQPQQSLRDLFRTGQAGQAQATLSPVPVSLADLARRLACSPTRLLPLIREGWLERVDGLPPQAKLTTATLLHPLPDAAYAWLRGWLLPARAKPLFSLADAAKLLSCSEREVTVLAARTGIPVSHEPALGGLVFSAWGVKRLLVEQASGGHGRERSDSSSRLDHSGHGRLDPGRRSGHSGRFDRQALLHALLEADPVEALQPPTFSQRLEQEIARAAALPEPARGIRAAALIEQWRNARLVAGDRADASKLASCEAQLSRLRRGGGAREAPGLTTLP